MSNNLDIANNSFVNEITEKIWHSFNILRGQVSTDDFHLVLFLLTIKRIGFKSEFLSNFNEAQDSILEFLRNSDNANTSSILDIYSYYDSLIYRFPHEKLVQLYEVIDSIDAKLLDDNFIAIFDSILYKFLQSQGKFSGEFILPIELSRLMTHIANSKNNEIIYNPFAGAASFGVFTPVQSNYLGQEINRRTQVIGLLRLLASNSLHSKSLILGDSINQWNPMNLKFDLIIASPPFKMKLPEKIQGKYGFHSTIESFFIEKALDSINNSGKIIMIIPEGILTDQSTTLLNIKRELIKSDLLEMIISLPSGIFKNTAIRTSILVINNSKNIKGYVKFVKSDNFIKYQNRTKVLDWESLVNELIKVKSSSIKTIGNSEIIQNDNLLNVNRYFLEHIQNGLMLDEILSPYDGIKIREVFESRVLNLKDIKDLNINIDDLEIRKEFNKTFFRKIEESCLLIAPNSNYLKLAWFEYTGEPVMVKHNIKAFKVDLNKVDIGYLIHQFQEKYVINQLDAFAIGSIIPMINVSDILKLKINLPSLVEQKDWVNKKFLKSLDFEKDKIALIREQFNNELGSKQHNIRQHLKNVKDSLDVLVNFMSKNNGVLKNDDIINPLRGITVSKRIESLQASLNNVVFEVNNLTNENNFSSKETIDLILMINEAIEEHVTSNFEIDFKYDELIFEEIKNFKYEIEFSKRDFKELINNVIENAVNHGFIDKTKLYKLLIYLGYEDNSVILQIVNNGIPFPKEISKSFGIKGVKAGKSGNKGIGVWKIIQAIRHFGHDFSIIDEPESEFPVGWSFKFIN